MLDELREEMREMLRVMQECASGEEEDLARLNEELRIPIAEWWRCAELDERRSACGGQTR